MLASMLQTYDYYKDREWKGLDKGIKKDVEKAKLGKIGIATGYTKLEEAE